MFITGILKDRGYLMDIFRLLTQKVQSKKLRLGILTYVSETKIKVLPNHLELVISVIRKKIERLRVIGVVMLVDMRNS
jgi:hypothetical protein